MQAEQQSELLPCPFCGGEAKRAKTMDESLWSHDTVPYHKVYCPECEIGTEYRCEGWDPTADEAWNRRAALSHPSTAQGWQPISTAPEGELVVVGWLDDEDTEHPERHDFDWLEDGLWQKHSADHEHFLMVAPPGSRGPSEKAPYTHWQRIGAIPAPPEQGGKG